MGCGNGFMRMILIVFNTLFFLGGLAGLGGGIWMAVKPGSLFNFIGATFEGSEQFLRNSAYVFIGASCFIILVAGLGCFGACARNKCALGSYAALMIIILCIQIAAIVLVVVFDQQFKEEAKAKAGINFNKAYNASGDGKNEFKNAVSEVQKEFKCCGINGIEDYRTPIMIKPIPAECTEAADGCYEAIKAWTKKNLGLVIGVTIAIIVFQVILFTFAICLCRSDFDKVV